MCRKRSTNNAPDASARNECGIGIDENCGAAEVLQVEAHFGEQFCGIENGCGFHGGAFDGFGDQQPLRFDAASKDAVAEMFVHDAFVQGVLIDDFQTGVAGHYKVAVVNLEGSEFVGDDFRRGHEGG